MEIKDRFVVTAKTKASYVVRENVLCVVIDGNITMYMIKKKLSSKDLKKLDQDIEVGLKKIKGKLRSAGPIVIKAGEVFFDDVAIIKAESDKTAVIGLIGE